MKRLLFLIILFPLSIYLFANDLNAQEKQLTNEYKKETIQKISLLIKSSYVLKDKRDFFAAQLNAVSDNGSYDSILDYEGLARQITTDLHKITKDHHFAVVYDPARVAEMRIEDDEVPNEEELEVFRKKRFEKRRKNNFGFRKVEILDGNIGYLDFRFFRGDSLALETAHAAMAFLSNSDALIIDLRKNYGGGAAMFQLLTSYFFGEKPVLLGELYNGLSDETQQNWTNPDISRYKVPELELYILISKETFSAAEAFAYSFKHLNRAIIVGEPSGGGAHMSTRMEINDEFYIFMPFAGAINPITNSNWEGVGVQPQVEVKSEDALKIAHILILQKMVNKAIEKEYRLELENLIKAIEK